MPSEALEHPSSRVGWHGSSEAILPAVDIQRCQHLSGHLGNPMSNYHFAPGPVAGASSKGEIGCRSRCGAVASL